MTVGRWLLVIGLGFVAAGFVAMLGSKLGLPRLGRLPGDMVFRWKNGAVYFPIVTCIVVSIVLTLLLAFFRRLR